MTLNDIGVIFLLLKSVSIARDFHGVKNYQIINKSIVQM